jgi:hypothetical protein
MLFWLGLIVGLFIGGTLGVFVMACCAASSRADEKMEAK